MNTPVTDPNSPRTSALAGQVVAENFAGWSAEIRQEFADNAHNHQVGSVLLSAYQGSMGKIGSMIVALY